MWFNFSFIIFSIVGFIFAPLLFLFTGIRDKNTKDINLFVCVIFGHVFFLYMFLNQWKEIYNEAKAELAGIKEKN